MVEISACILTENECYQMGQTIIPKGIMVHSTGANNPNLSRYVGPDDGVLGENPNGNHWNHAGVNKCVHAFVGKDAMGKARIYQTLPWNWRGWHAGGSANNTHISYEICEDDLSNSVYFLEVYHLSVRLTAYLCKEYGLDPMEKGVIICHSEGYDAGVASNHGDVMHWFPRYGKSMDSFRNDVKNGSCADGRKNELKKDKATRNIFRVALSFCHFTRSSKMTMRSFKFWMGTLRDKIS